MNTGIITPTRGPWWASPTLTDIPGWLTIKSEERSIIAMIPPNDDGTPNYADAGSIAANPHLIEALVDIQMRINSNVPISKSELNQIISNAFEKIYIEADV